MSKRLNKKPTVTKPLTSSLETDLKHDWDARDGRYWVNKDKFWEFQVEYDELQDEQRNPVSVELHIIVKIKEVFNGVIKKQRCIFTTENSVWRYARCKAVS